MKPNTRRFPSRDNSSTEATPLTSAPRRTYATAGPSASASPSILMEKLHSSRLRACADRLQVDHEDGLTTSQLMVWLRASSPPLLIRSLPPFISLSRYIYIYI